MRPSDVQSLQEAVLPIPPERLNEAEAGARAFVRIVHRAGGDPIPEDLRSVLLQNANDATLVAEADYSDLDENTDVLVDLPATDTEQVEVRNVSVAAGYGSHIENEPLIGHMGFKAAWMRANGLYADKCTVIRVYGKSMEPTLVEGSSILVNRASRERKHDRIFVVRTEEGPRVKRVYKSDRGWYLVSDNPEWKDIAWPQDVEIIGEVKWIARTLR